MRRLPPPRDTHPGGARVRPGRGADHGGGGGPGEKEDQQGRPFVGAAGKLLTELVESIGLTRRDIYITNTVRCRPPGNRDPEPDEVQACSHFLDEQISPDASRRHPHPGPSRADATPPESVGISRLHGQRVVRDDRAYVPLYHPAAALYNGSLRETLFADMQRVRGYLDEAEAMRARATQ